MAKKAKECVVKTPDGKPVNMPHSEILKDANRGIKEYQKLKRKKGWKGFATENLEFWKHMKREVLLCRKRKT